MKKRYSDDYLFRSHSENYARKVWGNIKLGLVLALVLWLLAVVTGKAQSQAIPKYAEAMEVRTSYSDSALYKSTLLFLEQEKFTIDKADSLKRSINTEYLHKGKGLIHIRLLITIANKIIVVKGQGRAQGMGYLIENEPLENANNSLKRKGFEYLDDIVRRLSRRLPNSTYHYIISQP